MLGGRVLSTENAGMGRYAIDSKVVQRM